MKWILGTFILLCLSGKIFALNVYASVPEKGISQLYIQRSELLIKSKGTITIPLEDNLLKTPPTHWNENDHTSGFHLGGFALGLFLPIAGIFIAKSIGGKAKENRKKWAMIGSAVTVGLILIIIKSLSTKY